MAQKGGLLRSLRDAVDTHVIPVALAHGFAFDPSSPGKAEWNDNGYDWYLSAQPKPGIVVRLRITTGVARDPTLHANWAAFDLGETGLDATQAAQLLNARIEKRGDDFTQAWIMSAPAADPISLSPWRRAAGSFSLVRWVEHLPPGTALRLVAGILVYPFLLIWLAMTFPITILAIFMELRWLKSDAAKSGARQDKIARRFAKRLDRGLSTRLPKVLSAPANAREAG